MSRSNRELREEATALAAELGRDLGDISGLKNHDLLALVDELVAAKEASGTSNPVRASASSYGAVRTDLGRGAGAPDAKPEQAPDAEPEQPAALAVAPSVPLPPPGAPLGERGPLDPHRGPINGAEPEAFGGAPEPPLPRRARNVRFPDTCGFVARGRAITSRRGVLAEDTAAGPEVRMSDLTGGTKQLEALVSAGVIIPLGR